MLDITRYSRNKTKKDIKFKRILNPKHKFVSVYTYNPRYRTDTGDTKKWELLKNPTKIE